MVDIWLPYGKTEVCVRVPTENLLEVIEPKEKNAAENPQAEIENALMNPLGTERLAEIVRPGDRVALVLKDSGLPTNDLMVSAVSKELDSAGIRNENVTVIVAYDPLRFSSPREGKPLLSEDLSTRFRIVRHNLENGEYVRVGKTSRGTEVYLDEAYVKADVKVLEGVIEPHPYVGYSGGREGVLPGISSVKTVQHNLLLSLNPNAKRGFLEGNPVHEDMVEAARLARVDFSLNIVRNSGLKVVKGFAGDVNEAFDEGVKLVNEMYKIPIESKADIVFVSPGGSPFDIDLFEACKAVDGALEATKRGKTVVLVAECMKGCGNNEFWETMSRFKSRKALERHLKRRVSVGGLMAYRLMKAHETADMFLVSVMPDYYISRALGLKTARTANEALRYAFGAVGKKGKVSVIPYGNFTMPLVKASN